MKKQTSSEIRSQITKLSNELSQNIIEAMEKHNVGLINFCHLQPDAVFTVDQECDTLDRVGAVVIPKTYEGERWVGYINADSMKYNHTFLGLLNQPAISLEEIDKMLDDGADCEWWDYVHCIDDECMFPVETYYQISESLEQALATLDDKQS